MNRRQNSGFTLIELAIVAAIVGLLMVVAFGFYGDNVISSSRTEGRAALQAAAGQLEKCKSLYGSYNHANCSYANFRTDSNLYDITAARTATTFTLTATPVTGTSQAGDADCTTLTLTNTGVRGATGANTPECW